MAQIYKIVNTVNDKVYVGTTEDCFIKRFEEHCRDSKKERCEKRPLYNAMRKHGIEQFSVELVCETATPEQDEIIFINKHNSYKAGYNATLGGDGRKYIDIDEKEMITTYLTDVQVSIDKLTKLYGVSEKSIRNILRANSIEVRSSIGYISQVVKQLTLDGVMIATHTSVNEAGRSLGKINGSHISACILGKRKSAYGFTWE